MDEPSPPSYQGPTSLRTIVVSRLLNIAATACSPKLAVRSRPTPDSFSADRAGSLVLSGPSPLLGQTSPAQHQHSTAQHSTVCCGRAPRSHAFRTTAHGLSPVHGRPQAPRPTSVRLWIRGTTNLVSVQLAAQLQEPERQRACTLLRHCSTARRLSKLSMRVHVH